MRSCVDAGALPAGGRHEPESEVVADVGRGIAHRVAGEMRVPGGTGHPSGDRAGRRSSTASHRARGRRRRTCASSHAGGRVRGRAFAHSVPGVVEVDQARALLPAREHPRIARRAEEAVEYSCNGGGQRHHPRTGLRVGEAHLAGVEVQVVLAKPEDFVSPASGQREEPDGRRRMG